MRFLSYGNGKWRELVVEDETTKESKKRKEFSKSTKVRLVSVDEMRPVKEAMEKVVAQAEDHQKQRYREIYH